MGTFVLGILVGWLAEWLFFNFWIKDGPKDSSALMRSLEDTINQNRQLKKQLKEATAGTTSKSKKSSTVKMPTKAAPKKKAATTKKPAPKKVTTAKKATTTKSTKSTVAKKAAPKKAAAKKVAAKKTPVKKTKVSGDDLTKLAGIGPSMAGTLKELGIDSYKKLADTNNDILRDMLEQSGVRLNTNKEAVSTWNEQAILAGKGDFAGLEKLQDTFKK